MLSKRWIRIFLILIIVWLVITIYFYNQHKVSIKRCVIDKSVVYEDSIIKFDEIVLTDFKQNRFGFENWRWDIVDNLPVFLHRPFMAISYFYSKPFEKLENNDDNQFGVLELRGNLIGENLDDEYYQNINEKISLIDEKGNDILGTASGSNFSSETNILYVYKQNEYFNKERKISKLVIKDDNDNIVTSIPLNIKWETENYNYFHRIPSENYYLNPRNIVREFIQRKVNDEDYEDLFYLQEENINHNYWKGKVYSGPANYIGNYKDWDEVYLSEIKFIKNEKIAKQKVYLIDTGKIFKIVDIGPLIIEK